MAIGGLGFLYHNHAATLHSYSTRLAVGLGVLGIFGLGDFLLLA